MRLLAFGVAQAEVSQAAQILPDILLRGALLFAETHQVTQHVVIQLAGELAVEIAELQILLVLGLGFIIGAAQAQAFR